MPRDSDLPGEWPPPDSAFPWRGTGLLFGFGFALWWLCAREPAALPDIAPWQFSWLVYLGTASSLWWFTRGLRVIPLARWRRACFTGGVASIYLMLQTRADYWAQHMFFLSQAQHSVLQSVAPFMIAAAAPGAVLRAGLPRALSGTPLAAVRSVVRLLQQPILVSLLFLGTGTVWLVPSVQFRAMLDPVLYQVMNVSMAASGLLFWCFLMDARPVPLARAGLVIRIAISLLIGLPMIGVGTVIGSATSDLYANFALCGRLFPGIDAMADQQIGALILWMPSALLTGTAMLLLAKRMFEEDDKMMMARLAEARR